MNCRLTCLVQLAGEVHVDSSHQAHDGILSEVILSIRDRTLVINEVVQLINLVIPANLLYGDVEINLRVIKLGLLG